MVWEAVFFLLLLKIPVVYLAFVVWWAVRSEPSGGDPAAVAAVTDTPPEGPGFGRREPGSRTPHPDRPHRRSRTPYVRRRTVARAHSKAGA